MEIINRCSPYIQSQNGNLQAFHNDPATKQRYLTRVRSHETAGEIVQRYPPYWKDGKGCAIGCTVHSKLHTLYETELGIPRLYARLEDRLFEGMSATKAKALPGDFLAAIAIGANLASVWSLFIQWKLLDAKDGVINSADTSELARSIELVALLYKEGCTERQPWLEAASFQNREKEKYNYHAVVAEQACRWATYAALYPEHADGWAANAVDVAASCSKNGRSNAYDSMAEKLLELLASA